MCISCYTQALITIEPGALFVLEGTGQADRYPGMAWGNGFITDPDVISLYNLSSPRSFFESLIAEPDLAARTVLSAHVYGLAVTVRSYFLYGNSCSFPPSFYSLCSEFMCLDFTIDRNWVMRSDLLCNV